MYLALASALSYPPSLLKEGLATASAGLGGGSRSDGDTAQPSSSKSVKLDLKQNPIFSVASPHVVSRAHPCKPHSWSLARKASFSGSF